MSLQCDLPNTRLLPDHNDNRFVIIEDADGREVHFSHEVVANRRGFVHLRRGQRPAYKLEDAPYLRATAISVAGTAPQALRPAA